MENEEIIDTDMSADGFNKEKDTKMRPRKSKEFKEKKCEVINYDKNKHVLDIKFDGYGIRIKNVESLSETNAVIIKYKSDIGKSDFKVEL